MLLSNIKQIIRCTVIYQSIGNCVISYSDNPNEFLWRQYITLTQCFSTFFDSRHPSFLIEQFGGTPNSILPVNRRQVHKMAAPQEFFTAPKGSVAPRLRTTALTWQRGPRESWRIFNQATTCNPAYQTDSPIIALEIPTKTGVNFLN